MLEVVEGGLSELEPFAKRRPVKAAKREIQVEKENHGGSDAVGRMAVRFNFAVERESQKRA